MYRVIVLLACLLATANAFAPMGRVSSRSALKMSFDEEASGVLPPVGYWDPLGTSTDCCQAYRVRALREMSDVQQLTRVSSLLLCYALNRAFGC